MKKIDRLILRALLYLLHGEVDRFSKDNLRKEIREALDEDEEQ